MDAIGEKILLDGDPHTIIGVMPPEFSFPQRRAQVWRPLRFRPADLANRSNNYLSAIARRKPDVSLEQARQEMRLISARLATQYPKENSALSATVEKRHEYGGAVTVHASCQVEPPFAENWMATRAIPEAAE